MSSLESRTAVASSTALRTVIRSSRSRVTWLYSLVKIFLGWWEAGPVHSALERREMWIQTDRFVTYIIISYAYTILMFFWRILIYLYIL